MKRILWAVVLMCAIGCTDAEKSRIGSLGSKFKVTLYSNGDAVRTWQSTGKVMTETDSDGWYFTDASTNKLVRVSGSVVVEQE